MRIVFLRIVFVVAVACCVIQETYTNTMKIVYFNSYAPFSYEENGIMKGILVDVLDEALVKRMKLEISHAGFPWVRAQEMVRNGDADAFVTIPTEQRLFYTTASKESVVAAKVTLFAYAKNPLLSDLMVIKNVDELRKYRVGQYLGHGWAKQNLEDKGIHIYWVPAVDNIFLMLINNRIDLTAEIDITMRYMIKKSGYQNDIIEIPVKLDMSSWHLCVGKTSQFKDILPKFDKAIDDMRRDGTLESIYKKYR